MEERLALLWTVILLFLYNGYVCSRHYVALMLYVVLEDMFMGLLLLRSKGMGGFGAPCECGLGDFPLFPGSRGVLERQGEIWGVGVKRI